jgi:hypothetical protein
MVLARPGGPVSRTRIMMCWRGEKRLGRGLPEIRGAQRGLAEIGHPAYTLPQALCLACLGGARCSAARCAERRGVSNLLVL